MSAQGWTAPPVHRRPEPLGGGERESLEGWLDYHRDTLLTKCAGLTADQLRTRSVPPSSLSLLGLVRHMTEVEQSWFRRRMTGAEVPPLYYSDDNPDGDFDDVDTADPETDLATFLAEVERCREAVAGLDLDDTFQARIHRLDLRWIFLHMIEEYARHNGHADLLRERIDGVTGE